MKFDEHLHDNASISDAPGLSMISPLSAEIIKVSKNKRTCFFHGPTLLSRRAPRRMNSNRGFQKGQEHVRSLGAVIERMTRTFKRLCLRRRTFSFFNKSDQLVFLASPYLHPPTFQPLYPSTLQPTADFRQIGIPLDQFLTCLTGGGFDTFPSNI